MICQSDVTRPDGSGHHRCHTSVDARACHLGQHGVVLSYSNAGNGTESYATGPDKVHYLVSHHKAALNHLGPGQEP